MFVLDPSLKRQLMFRSQYDIECSLIEDPIIKSTITAVAKSNVNDLRPVCDKGTVMTNTNIIHIYISKTNTKSWVGTFVLLMH